MGRPWKQSRVASDAEFICWQTKREGDEELIILCNGSYVEIDGRRVLASRRRITRCEMRTREGHKEIDASEADALQEEQLDSTSQQG
jgi:hypothetical protein